MSLILVSNYTDHSVLAHTPKGDCGIGVCSYALNVEDGQLQLLNTLAVGPNVAFLLKHPKKNILYATTECIDNLGEVLTLSLSGSGELQVLERRSAMGRSTCYLNIDNDCKYLTVVNYWDAKVVSFSLSEEGLIEELCDTDSMPGAEYVEKNNPNRVEHWKYRQRWPHTHCAVTAPLSAGRMFVCDLGRDKVLHYVIGKSGELRQTGEVQMDKQLGPRGLEFHPSIPVAYISNELTSTVSVCLFNVKREQELNDEPVFEDLHDPNALLHETQRLSTLPPEEQDKYFTNEHGIWKAASHSSEIRLHPSGRFLYIGNRGHDSIACFAIDQATGALTLSGICPSGGKCPRNFNIDPTGRWMIVGNQDSNVLTVFSIDASTGLLSPQSEVPCPSVNYVYALPA